jgi:BirA family biotin operon repressor/biotin-[acetyl-CoA-carboxylase] ligase
MDETPLQLDRIAAESGVASLEFQPQAVSTNDWALQLAVDDARSWPLLVLTQQQIGGRGRGANRWWSAAGALTFSLVIDPLAWHIPIERWPQIALIAGLAICECLQEVYPPGVFGLKWPNDVYLNGRKVAGILVEAPSQRSRIIVGVGVNVNNSFSAAPPDVRERATSLADTADGEFDLTETLIAIVQRMNRRLASFDAASLASGFDRYCLLRGHNVQIEASREMIVGRCAGIDADGALRIHTPGGDRRVHAGTVIAWE